MRPILLIKIAQVLVNLIYLVVSYFQNEFLKSSFLPQYVQKIVRISDLTTQGRNPSFFWRNDDF